jgi:hypothetical protein
VPRRIVHLLGTERHVEHALAEGKVARTWRAFVAGFADASGLFAAHPEMTRLATEAALGEISAEYGLDPSSALVGTLDGALGVLRDAGIEGAALKNGGPRADLFARLLVATEARLAAAGSYDRRSAGFLAARSIAAAPLDELPRAVVIEGLFDWNAAEHAWVEALARRIPTTVRMPRWAATPSPCTRAPDVLLSSLEERWQRHSRGPELDLVDIAFPGQVELLEAPSAAAEARCIAGAVADALAAGTKASGIAMVLPALDESFLEPLRAALDEAGVAFSEPRGRPPIATPVVRAALSWLAIASGSLARDALVDWLRTSVVDPAPFIDGPNVHARRERALLLCRRLARIPVSVDHEGTLLANLLAADVGDADDATWLVESLDKILAARRDLAVAAPRKVLAERLLDIWQTLGLGAMPSGAVADLVGLEDTPNHGEGLRPSPARANRVRLLRALIREQSAGHTALVAAIERVVLAAEALGMGHDAVSLDRLRGEIEDALQGAPPRGTHRPGTCRIVRVAEVTGLRCELLIVARASDGVFETTSGAQAVLGDELIAALPRTLRPHAALAVASERTALLVAMAGARRVLATRSTTDGEGRPLAPAPLFSELAEDRPIARGASSVLDPRARPLSQRAAELVLLSQGAAIDDADLARRVAIEKTRLEFFLDPRLAANAVTGAISTVDPALSAHLAEAVGGTAAHPIAATALERAAGCRFAAFALGVLGAKITDEAGEELEPWQRGSLVHRALHIALEATRTRWDHLERRELIELGMTAARRALLRDRCAPLYRAEVERALRDVAAVLAWSLDDTSGFRFAYGERSFGETARGRDTPSERRAAWPALLVGDGRHAVFVKGRIDRVDTQNGGARARVIDYKTGVLPAWKDVGTLVFQPPLYALAVWLHLGPLSLPEVRALYLDTSKRPPRAFPAEKSQVLSPEMMKGAQERAQTIVLRMRAGEVAPRPVDALVCARCSVRDVCRRPAAMPIDDLEQEGEGAAS